MTTYLAIDCKVHTWFERDRQHIELRHEPTQDTVCEWWDQAVTEVIEDGFIDARRIEQSTMSYALDMGWITDFA